MRAKEFLLQARGIDAEIRSLKETEREAWERVTNVTPNYDGNVISGSKDPHKFDFLMDYIDGDRYYKIAYPTHNLVRTKAQQRLLESMEKQYSTMQEIVASI